MRQYAQRLRAKVEQSRAFIGQTKTPLPLVLDAFQLRRSSFVAETKDRIKLRMNAGESFTFFENLVRRDYLTNGIKLGLGDTVMDIGANIGSFTVLAATVVGPFGRVVAYEPVPGCGRRLRDNIELNRLRNVTCYQAAVDGHAGILELFATEKSALSTSCIPRSENNDADKISVKALTIEQAFNDNGLEKLSLLKIDCEGSEYEIFETMTSQVACKIDQIAMEVHAVPNRSFGHLETLIRSLGFDLRTIGNNWF